MTSSTCVPRAVGRAARFILLAALAAEAAACGRPEETPREPTPARSTADASAKAPASPADSATRAAADRSRVLGDSTAPVWVVMISDFQCPYCKLWHDSTGKAIVQEYVRPGQVRMAYINFPLPSHKNAWPAAEAAMCAGAQGRFWPMHDALFAEQERWSGVAAPAALLDSIASGVGVDAAAMRQCVSSGVMRPLIQADLDRSSSAGVNSTPTFVIGDSVISGAYPIDRFRTVIDAALAKK
jgi:protein-disulfide isomerase